MAENVEATIKKFEFLDQAGIQSLSKSLLEKTNLRIDERIIQDIADADANHVPSATLVKALIDAGGASGAENAAAIAALEEKHDTDKAALEASIAAAKTEVTGKVTALETKHDTEKTALDTAIGNVATSVTTLESKVDALTHLTIETVTGAITSVADPDPSVLYLQRDDESDTTWVMYIFQESNNSWVAIGDTSVDLVNYWAKSDIAEMREALEIHDVQPLTDAQITAAVDAAFADTPAFPAE